MIIPEDPAILLSFVNTKLRDFYPSLKEMCSSIGVEEEKIKSTLAKIGYEYNEQLNKFN